MIPRIQTGSSFKGAALYYLHDKRQDGEAERLTTDRVAWTHSVNTVEDDPERVIAEMQHTAMLQSWLKQQAGKRTDGRPTENTVMTLSLSWPKDQAPTRDDMIATGQSFIDYMGWQEHQALFVAHNDTAHPHVHLIINRVHPETGMTIDDKWYKTRSQKWALGYEREQGRIYCDRREQRYGSEASNETYREWELWRKIAREGSFDPEFRDALKVGEWDALKASQRDERMAFWKETGQQFKELRKAVHAEIKKEFAPAWQAYAKEKEERLRKARLYDQEARRAKRHLRQAGPKIALRESAKTKHGKKVTRALWDRDGVRQIELRQKAYHDRMREELYAVRTKIYTKQKKRSEELGDIAIRNLKRDRTALYADVLHGHRDGRAKLARDQRGGQRRFDTLGRPASTPPSQLTKEQERAYLHEARAFANPKSFSDAKREITREQAATEQLSAKEKKQNEMKAEGQRLTGVAWYLAKKAKDREGGRGGGGGRER